MKYIIVANGPFLVKSIIAEVARGALIIALDGAANKLARLGFKPNIILGDFDSINEDSETAKIWGITQSFDDIVEEPGEAPFSSPYQGNYGTTIVPAKDQNFTDFQKSLKFAMQYANHYNFPLATSVHVVCALGGRIDHDQANLRTLQSEYNDRCPVYLHSECQTMTFVSDREIKIIGNHHDHCGLFGMPEASMSVKNDGLEYGGEEPYNLRPLQYSSSNRLIGTEGAIVEIKGNALIVNPPMFESQRLYFQKSREDQLSELLRDSLMELYSGKASQCKRALDNLSNSSDILCVSHLITTLETMNDEMVLMSVPREHFEQFTAALCVSKPHGFF
ncbi:MAG: thiamine pyrophosphokinase [Legionellaceae bacterium]|nr:thiamine pyrophosphokinase [Legionellaceae bacterium]